MAKIRGEALLLLLLGTTILETLAGKCQVGRACIWDQFRSHVDWDYLDKANGDCSDCEKLCAATEGCTGYECGQSYCASWLFDACNETRVDNYDGITTCRMSGNMTSADHRPRASCRHRCGEGPINLNSGPDGPITTCSCQYNCYEQRNCCYDYQEACHKRSVVVRSHPSRTEDLPATQYHPRSSTSAHSWYYVAPAIMGASITSFCILFLWFRYQHRRRAAAAAQAQRQFQRLEEISEYDPVVAISPIRTSRGNTYAIPVPEDDEDPNAFLLKSCMVYPIAKPVQATVVDPGSIFPHDIVAAVPNTNTNVSNNADPTPGVTHTTPEPEL